MCFRLLLSMVFLNLLSLKSDSKDEIREGIDGFLINQAFHGSILGNGALPCLFGLFPDTIFPSEPRRTEARI